MHFRWDKSVRSGIIVTASSAKSYIMNVTIISGGKPDGGF